jgi:hypothetical protein
MSSTDRQTRLNITEDWKRIYQSFRNADFQSYDFDNLRRTMINYLRQNYPEDFNDYVESSEFTALIDLIAFLGQNLSFRVDLNARENFLETAERRESVLRLARLISYNPKRNINASGLLKIEAVKTSEDIIDSTGINLNSLTIKWNDIANASWFEQYIKVLNAALPVNNAIGRPAKSENISGVRTEKYKVNGSNTDVPVFSYQKTVEGLTTDFEIVSSDIENGLIKEEAPIPGNNPAFLYRDDGQGAGSSNTGFFVLFKQGILQSGEFSVSNPVPNQIVAIDSENINNSDVWLYSIDSSGFENELWSKIDSVEGNNIIYNNLVKSITKTYAVTSRVDDRINLVFSDGVFGELPSGNFRTYYRTSANRALAILPSNMTGINIDIPYTSRKNTQEKLTLTCSLKYTVSNSTPTESSDSIKSNAPANYYTQNRLITAEDYAIGPLGISQDIIKSRSINRISSGISKYFDLKDPTGKYSNLNIYANDGVLYREQYDRKTSFSFTTQSDIEGIIYNVIEPILGNSKMLNFYYSNFSKTIVSDLNAAWTQTSSETNLSTGYFSDTDGQRYTVGTFTLNSLRLIEPGTLCKFEAPEGFHFMANDNYRLMPGPASHRDSVTYKWAKIAFLTGDGTVETNNVGPIGFNDSIPTGAILTEIRTKLSTKLIDDVKTQIIDRVFAFQDFALRYDSENRIWRLITSTNIDTTSDFNVGKAGDTSGQGLDASWLLYFKTNGETYTITYRLLRYVFESADEIRFFYDDTDKIFDPKTNKIYRDQIQILNINNKPDSLGIDPFTVDFDWGIEDAYRDNGGYVNSKKLEISFFDSDNDGVIDDPELFDQIVAPNSNIANKIIIQKKYTTTDGIEDYRYFDNTSNTIRILENASEQASLAPSILLDGDVVYLLEEKIFRKYNKTLREWKLTSDYRAYTGRHDLKFHYIHTSNSDYRIDPAVSNIIDVYILTKGYDTQYRLWLAGELAQKPLPPSNDELFRTYGTDINKIKSISDEIVYHPVKYKVLFGNKAETSLQATIKIVKNPDQVVNNNDIKSRVINAINSYFATSNWDFGDTFYFQELTQYIMNTVSPDLVSVLMVPKQPTQAFGSLFEIQSQPDEIFVSGATVGDIEVIDEITATQLQASGNIVTSNVVENTGVQSANSNLLNYTTENNTTTTTTTTSSSSSSSSSSSGNSGYGSGGYSY